MKVKYRENKFQLQRNEERKGKKKKILYEWGNTER